MTTKQKYLQKILASTAIIFIAGQSIFAPIFNVAVVKAAPGEEIVEKIAEEPPIAPAVSEATTPSEDTPADINAESNDST